MLIAAIEYSNRAAKDWSEDQRAAMLENWPGLRNVIASREITHKDRPDEIWNISSWEYGNTQRITLEEAHALEIAGIALSLEGVDGTMMTKMKHRADKYGSITPMEMTTGQVVQIAVPDLGILQINETDWLEDACTEELQARLDDGWRILAVCPPNAQRRPDYILGRHNPEKSR